MFSLSSRESVSASTSVWNGTQNPGFFLLKACRRSFAHCRGAWDPTTPFDPIPASLGSRTLTPFVRILIYWSMWGMARWTLRCEGENGEESERCGGENTPTLGVAAPIHRALHVGSPRDLWPCVLPKWQFNVGSPVRERWQPPFTMRKEGLELPAAHGGRLFGASHSARCGHT